MDDKAIIFGFNLLLWFYLAYRFSVALAKRKITNGASLHVWGVIFGCYLIAALTAEPIKLALDGQFGGLPMSTLVRSLLMLVTIHLYFLGMRQIYPYSPPTQRLFRWGNPLFALTCIGLFLWYAAARQITVPDLNLQIKGVRDVAILLWLRLILLPSALHLWRTEQVRPMKLHRVTDLAFYGVVLVQCSAEIALAVSTYHLPALTPVLAAIERGSTYVCLLLFLVMLLPLRLFLPLFYPVRLRLYLRLQRLERAVSQASTGRPPLGKLPLRLTHPDELELAIYQKVIAILDRYPSLKNRRLQTQITEVVASQAPFPELAQKLGAIQL
ncbi:MAG: hypothetical protein J0M07_21470 [Anaerolineae bacterium]|nr:hypothetical protein [Anaerolineae bacterium]